MSTITYLACPDSPRGRPRSQVAREAFHRLLDHLLDQGRFALHQLQPADARASAEARALLDAGYLRLDDQGQVALTPLALRAAEERLLAELYQPRGDGAAGRHVLMRPGVGAEPGDETQPHRAGDPLDHVDVPATLGEALRRGLPVALRDDDVRVRPGPASGRCACVLLIDLSGSMARHGKFAAARKAALALRALARSRFPGDVLITAGFASRAALLNGNALLEATPRSVGLFDPRGGGLRVRHDAEGVPEHFTNIQAGLRLAQRLLRQQKHAGKQVLLVTDGEPTAHVEGDELVLAYPPTEATVRHTLTEARRCAAEGVALGVFGLVGEFSPPGLESFVHDLARAGKGKAVCCAPRRLA